MQYVLLKHANGDKFHVDFLLDCGLERLLSWQICDENLARLLVSRIKNSVFSKRPKQKNDTIDLFCRRIFDHRKLYLNYEGDIAGDRGRVDRAECGKWELLEVLTRQIIIKTTGRLVTDDSQAVKLWQFQLPENFALNESDFSPPELMQRLPPPSDAKWHLQCTFL